MPSYTKKKHYKQRGSKRTKRTNRTSKLKKGKKRIKGGVVKGGTLQYFITCMGKLVNG